MTDAEALSGADAVNSVLIIGGGKMGEAILGGWLAAQEGPAAALDATSLSVVESNSSRREYLSQRYGVTCLPRASEAPKVDCVVLAVKPQVMNEVLEEIRDLSAYGGAGQGLHDDTGQSSHGSADQGPLFISIAAGLPTARIEAGLHPEARVVRVMPNTPLLVGAGATVVAAGSHAAAHDAQLVRELFACLGIAYEVDEGDIDAIGALSGSGPAYVAAMIEALRDATAAYGIDPQRAEELALQTVYGTAELMRQTGQSAEETRIAVCSPGGTTLVALAAMEEAGLAEAYRKGIDAAVQRSKELGSC